MTETVRKPPATNSMFAVWLALMATTGLSWYLGDGHGTRAFTTVGVLAAAFFKIHLVGRYFMELRDAPKALRRLFAGWITLMFLVLVTLYLFGRT